MVAIIIRFKAIKNLTALSIVDFINWIPSLSWKWSTTCSVHEALNTLKIVANIVENFAATENKPVAAYPKKYVITTLLDTFNAHHDNSLGTKGREYTIES